MSWNPQTKAFLQSTVILFCCWCLSQVTNSGHVKAKSLLEVKNGLSFLDIIARQVLNDRRTFRCDLPLVLMNSFSTREDSLAALEKYPELKSSIPLDFLQNKVPNKWRW